MLNRYLIVILICMTLVVSDFEHIFICQSRLLIIYMSSLKKSLLRSSPQFLLGFVFCFCSWIAWVLYIFWTLTPYLIDGVQIFSKVRNKPSWIQPLNIWQESQEYSMGKGQSLQKPCLKIWIITCIRLKSVFYFTLLIKINSERLEDLNSCSCETCNGKTLCTKHWGKPF